MKKNSKNPHPSFDNPKYFFPDIPYVDDIPALERDHPEMMSSSVSRMITHIKNSGLLENKDLFQGLLTEEKIEEKILELVKNYKNGDSLNPIFHLIEAWGGSAGRMFYVNYNSKKEAFENVLSEYDKLVSVCIDIHTATPENMAKLVNAGRSFEDNKEVSYLGISFITKHIHFWLTRNMHDNALPIFDRIISVWVMRKPEPIWALLIEYWEIMQEKAASLNPKISLRSLERQIFNYASKYK